MKASLISVILLAAVATVSAQPGGPHNTGVIPEIVVSPPSDGNGVGDKNVGPTDANKLGQSGMLYGVSHATCVIMNPTANTWKICDTRTRKPTCKKKIGGKWTSKKCLNKVRGLPRLFAAR
ncbi:unnamed protein product [Aspergillus oryzae]|uniref:Unnamed protein product n=1 Tax=Aspergillus oryzae TaxID=5062 RepID=A0AAN4YM00_ASPOZ|nr:unnamed protein product [Aspergillus oryzae]GMF91665.1 unnamed protein product [Aspergillus oryzae]GMG32119.1 unnamed protein product [Aspergillus oryzae]